MSWSARSESGTFRSSAVSCGVGVRSGASPCVLIFSEDVEDVGVTPKETGGGGRSLSLLRPAMFSQSKPSIV